MRSPCSARRSNLCRHRPLAECNDLPDAEKRMRRESSLFRKNKRLSYFAQRNPLRFVG